MAFAKALELLKLTRMASGRRGVTLQAIEQEFACSRRTAQRMTNALEALFPETYYYVDDEGFRRWVVPRRKAVELLAPRPDELAALDFAEQRMELEGFENELRSLRSLKATISALSDESIQLRAEIDSEALLEVLGFAARPGPMPSRDSSVDEAISEAIKAMRRLVIRYQGRRDSEPTRRRLDPHGLLLGARRYLIARDADKADGRLRHFRVEAISSAVVIEEAADLDPGFKIDAYAAQAFGSYHDPSEHVLNVWRFKPAAAEHARRFRFHPAQTLTDEPDGGLTVRFEASGRLEMAWHLYQWGDQVEVLSPPELKEMVHAWQRSDFAALP